MPLPRAHTGVAIVTDSTSYVPAALVRQHGIRVVPLQTAGVLTLVLILAACANGAVTLRHGGVRRNPRTL